MKKIAFGIVAMLLGLLLPMAVAEGLLRLLPVATGLAAEPVNAGAPVFRFAPERAFLWSRDWNFSIVNRGRTNNDGFVNDQPYIAAGPRPLVAVVGDSYVEALMVPYPQTLQGRLAADFSERLRFYSFAASGAPLSQYLVWMQYARRTYAADAMVVVVIGNDFDESLAEFKRDPGFHRYVEAGSGLVLERFDYAPGVIRQLLRRSALARYLLFNLHADVTLSELIADRGITAARAAPPTFVGNVAAGFDDHRLSQSRRAVAAFFRDLPAYADLPPQRILFVVDGFRYAAAAAAGDSYFGHMRGHFIAEARRGGYPVIDADDYFIPYTTAHPADRLEWLTDNHWNARAHGLIAEAIRNSSWLAGLGSGR